MDERWLNWPDSTSITAVYLHNEVICNNAFWREIDGLQAALQPIVCVLRLCDSERSTLGLLYEFMIRLRRVIQKCTTLSSNRVDAMLDIFDARWNWFCRPIHCVAHMLHPAWRSDAQRSDRVLLTGWNTYVERMYAKEDLLGYRGPVSWLPKQVDHRQIVVEAADVSQLQPRTAKDDVYDFIREDMMRFSRQTRSTTRRLRGESAVGISSARPQRAARARRPRRSVAELTSTSRRLTPTPSECESDDSCESDGSE
ncbi:hypothetical protein L7F22_067463 [Adiantum nelumboides]|nr:hypothetical protein [Adiantum nelumboides]